MDELWTLGKLSATIYKELYDMGMVLPAEESENDSTWQLLTGWIYKNWYAVIKSCYVPGEGGYLSIGKVIAQWIINNKPELNRFKQLYFDNKSFEGFKEHLQNDLNNENKLFNTGYNVEGLFNKTQNNQSNLSTKWDDKQSYNTVINSFLEKTTIFKQLEDILFVKVFYV